MAAVAWADAETKALLTIWGAELVQKLLAKATKNKNIYEIVSKELSKVGVERNWKQCRDRIKNLFAKYRKTKDKNRQSGGGTVTCPFYNDIDAVVGESFFSWPVSPCAVLFSFRDEIA